MKQICIGTIITLIYQSRKRSTDRIKDICAGIFKAYGLDINSFNDGLPSHLKNGHDPAPVELVNAARNADIETVSKGIAKYIVPLIHSEKHECLFRALKEVLREDSDISDRTIVGCIQGYEKSNILSQDTFPEAMTLANIITYAITATDNRRLSASIREISSNFVDEFKYSEEEIHFELPQTENEQFTPLKRSLKDTTFKTVFSKAAEFTVSDLANPTKVNIFYIEPNNCKFRFSHLKDFIINNIGSYVFSRAYIKGIVDRTKNQAAVGSHAMLKFIKTYGTDSETTLGEILLYIFLEQDLNAPKIMSKIELNEAHGNAVSKSDGVHLLSTSISGQPFHQLVFGASDIVGDLRAAIDRAFEKIINIESNSEEELQIIDNTTQWTIFDQDTAQFINKLLKPTKNGEFVPDMAFGAFLGYTIKLDSPETDSQKYRTAVIEQLKKDIRNLQPYIIKKIQDNGLSGYSFYFYTFPFNDATNEKVSIIYELLSGGGIS